VRKKLIIKSDGAVLGAYLVAPFAGAVILWSCLTANDLWRYGSSALARDFLFLLWILIYGTIACGIAELLFVIPFLFGFHRYRWKWLNGWTAALLGFLVGASIPFLHHVSVVDRPDQVLVSVCCGLVGVTIAMVFRLMAIAAEDDAA
jgi:hypothetical protein